MLLTVGRQKMLVRRLFLGSVALSFLTACFPGASNLPVHGDEVTEAVNEVLPTASVVLLDTSNVAHFSAAQADVSYSGPVHGPNRWVYRVGPDDVLKIIVWGVAELTDPSQYIEGAPAPGTVVQSDGSIFFPYAGSVDVRGKTIPEIREVLTAELSEFFPDPQVEVRVLEYNSQAAVVAGAVENPARYPLRSSPTRLFDLLAQAQISLETADIANVSVRRGDQSYSVNLKAYIEQGYAAANPLILNGDTVFVPTRQPDDVFVLGEINDASAVNITDREVSLTQVLSEAGGINLRDADARGIFVFRRVDNDMTVIHLDVSNPSAYLIGTQFVMQPNDVVFVTTDPVSRWNRVISDLLPSVGLYQAAESI